MKFTVKELKEAINAVNGKKRLNEAYFFTFDNSKFQKLKLALVEELKHYNHPELEQKIKSCTDIKTLVKMVSIILHEEGQDNKYDAPTYIIELLLTMNNFKLNTDKVKEIKEGKRK